MQTDSASSPLRITKEKPARRSRWISLPVQFVSLVTWFADVAAIVATALLCDAWGIPIRRVLPIALACYTAMAQVAGAYDGDALLLVKRAWPRVLNAWIGTVLALAMLRYSLGILSETPRQGLVVWFVAATTVMAASRALLITAARHMRHAGIFTGRAAVIGTGREGVALVDHVYRSDELITSLVGFFDDQPVLTSVAIDLPLPYLGNIDDLERSIRAGTIDRVFLALPRWEDDRVRGLVARLSMTPVEIRLAPDRAGLPHTRRAIVSMGGLPLIAVVERPLSPLQRLAKAVEDRTLALIGLIVLGPLMAIVAVAIRLDTKGPVLFRQQREGLNCRPFDILKFRTMKADGCASEIVQALRGDSRVTRVGAVLRRTSIDELPQLLNVLFGHMSLVGPRPHATATRAGGILFADVVGTYAARHNVKPGLTGWAQVSGWRGETVSTDQLVGRLRCDMYYIENWSIWFDIYIIGKTILTVLSHRTAY